MSGASMAAGSITERRKFSVGILIILLSPYRQCRNKTRNAAGKSQDRHEDKKHEAYGEPHQEQEYLRGLDIRAESGFIDQHEGNRHAHIKTNYRKKTLPKYRHKTFQPPSAVNQEVNKPADKRGHNNESAREGGGNCQEKEKEKVCKAEGQ